MKIVWLGLAVLFAGVGCGDVNLKNYCASPLVRCGDTCVDLQGDRDNCGACGSACSGDQACSAGTCTCAGAGGKLCGSTCVDTMTDSANCGGCGSACDSGSVCATGSCSVTCGAPFTECTDQATSKSFCTDTQTDFANCGACGSACDVFARCSTGHCAPEFAWESVTVVPSALEAPGTSDFSPPGEGSYYLIESTSLTRYDVATDTYTSLAAVPTNVSIWPGAARVGNALWLITTGMVLKYDIAGNAWTTVVASGVHANQFAGTTHDKAGKIYTFTSAGEVAVYDTMNGGSVTYVTTTILTSPVTYSEPHVVFDETSNLLYIEPNFDQPYLFSFDPTTGAAVSLAQNPSGQLNDVFCGDRQGHLFAAGSTNSADTSFYTYDIMNNVWTTLPALPFGHGDDGACAVVNVDEGYLYMTPGDNVNTARVALH